MQQSAPYKLGNLQRKRRYTIVAGCFIVGASLLAIKPVYDNTYYDFSLEVLGVLMILCGFGIRLWCTLYIGGKKNKDLLSDGPYSLCRNPLYVGSISAAIGIGLQTEMLTFGLFCGAACWVIFHVVVKREERYLLGEFGDAYRRYLKTTPRFWPRFSAYKDDLKEHRFRPSMLWNTFRDGLVLFAAIPVTEAIEAAHRLGLLKAAFLLY
ncbi:isoprenylcysteine carboxylmethyltransferase family protein (plasmid) [Rhizobium lusitanum]|uniref:methyltransferase family protein n=1 Tax=Rhizobium lusitanum TaxID=293958 RepID=UPI0016194B32|nr:isoprenylcysteine carboxylmethyltransferase family protein [Rhizobium lusitanum]QND45830.1 isoprenylcysteine carboxylmethyltransferase family protein [Rhizobium lusitanum]